MIYNNYKFSKYAYHGLLGDIMRKIEILAPAGSYESLIAAAGAGCDAAYIGGTMFGARMFSKNLEEETLLRAIDYMHVRDKRLYLTINTLLKNSEIEDQLCNYLEKYYLQGIDAVIVQDVGVMHFIHRNFPELPIHASTQMTLTMAEGAKLLESFSVSRIVTSRELSIKEIKDIRKKTSMEIESFVHGALCYSYSGQCLMSSLIGGRSGNRGRCAQPCRLKYRCGGENAYLLSPKDMCTLPMIPELIDAGIDSFKIEGRMKSYEYTAGVTAAYRKQIDLYQELGRDGYLLYHERHKGEIEIETLKLKDLYNRGDFHTGYYKGHNGKFMMSMVRPNHSGVLIGCVSKVSGIQMEIELNEEVYAQDILEVRTDGSDVYEFTLKESAASGKRMKANFKHGSKIRIGSEVYRTKNNQLLTELSIKYYETEQKILISGNFYASPNKPVRLEIIRKSESGENIYVSMNGAIAHQAKNQPMTEEKIRLQLNKTNESPFLFEDLNIYLDGDIFLPVSSLNELRRECLIMLEQEIVKRFRRKGFLTNKILPDRQVENNSRYFEKCGFTVSVLTINQLKSASSLPEISDIYLDITDIEMEDISKAVQIVKAAGKRLFLQMPHIFRKETYDMYMKYRIELKQDGISGYMIRNFEEYYFVMNELSEVLTTSELRLDYNMYVMNQEAKIFWEKQGIQRMTAPFELNEQELCELNISGMELIIYGRIPLMVSAQCIQKNTNSCIKSEGYKKNLFITDRMNKRLPVMTHCSHCYNTIYNSKVLSLSDCGEAIFKLNPASLRLCFTTESEDTLQSITKRMYQSIFNNEYSNEEADYTRGHFRRGIV